MNEYFFVITFSTETGGQKQLRIADANPSLGTDDLTDPIADIIVANIFDREKVGRLTGIKALKLETVRHTEYDLVS